VGEGELVDPEVCQCRDGEGHGSQDDDGHADGEGGGNAIQSPQCQENHQDAKGQAGAPGGDGGKELVEERSSAGHHDGHHTKQEQALQKSHGVAQPREVPADDRFIQLPDAGDLRQTDEQDAAEGEQDGGHRQAGKAPAAEAAKELPQLLAGDKARPQKAAGKEKGQLGYAQLFHKTTPLF